MRPHTVDEARFVVDTVDAWQDVFMATLGRRMVYAADEYYLLAERPFPGGRDVRRVRMHEDGIGMARAFGLEFSGAADHGIGVQPGFFAWVDGAPATGYRAPRGEPRRGRGVRGHPRSAVRGERRRPRRRRCDLGPAHAAPLGSRRHPHRDLRGRGARAPRRVPWVATTSASSRCRTEFFGGNVGRRRPDGRRGPDPGALGRARRAIGTSCPTSASPRAGSSTASHPTTCPARWRSSPPMACRSAGRWSIGGRCC